MEMRKKKIPTYIMIGVIFTVAIWFNVAYFSHRTSSNPQSISEYNLSDEDISPRTQPAVAGVFYAADIYQTDNNQDGFIEQTTSPQRYCPKIIIVPLGGFREATKVAWGAYKRLNQCRNKIKNVFILAPSSNKKNDIFILGSSAIKTPLGEVAINQKITAKLAKNPAFKSADKMFNRKNPLKIQLPFLQKLLSSFKIIPILYGKNDSKNIAGSLHKYLSADGNILIVSASLNTLIDDNANIIYEPQISGDAGLDAALLIAKEFGLVPQILDVTNIGDKEVDFTNVNMNGWTYEETVKQQVRLGTDLYHYNIKNFVRHHRDELIAIIKSSIKSLEKHRHYRIKRKNFDNYLFNQGASYITLRFADGEEENFGTIYAYKAVAADIADNIYHLLSDAKMVKEIKGKKIDLKVELLTEPEEIEFISYDDLLEKITPFADGLIIKSGEREGALGPAFWQTAPSKDAFITQLKMKAGLSPTYWSDEVKIFKFRTVEVN